MMMLMGVKGVCFIMELFREVGSVAITVESSVVCVVMCGEASSCLFYVGLIAIWAHKFVDSK